MIRNNSEIKKSIWLDFNITQLILIPFILWLILFYRVSTFKYGTIEESFFFFYFLFVGIFGSYKTASSFLDEKVNKTWDNIKLSSIAPWKLIIGKFIGSTLMAWYGGLLNLLIIGLFQYETLPLDEVVTNICGLIVGGIFCQVLSLLIGFIYLQSKNIYGKVPILVAVLISSWITLAIYNEATSTNDIIWCGFKIENIKLFYLCLVSILAYYTFIILYRLVRQEFKMRNKPYFVIISLPIFAFILTAFYEIRPRNESYSTIFFLLFIIITSVLFFLDNIKGLKINQLIYYWKNKKISRFLELLPTYWLALVWVFISLFFVIFSNNNIEFSLYIIVCCLLLRDLIIIQMIFLSTKINKKIPLISAYLGVFYFMPFRLNKAPVFETEKLMCFFGLPYKGQLNCSLVVALFYLAIAISILYFLFLRKKQEK